MRVVSAEKASSRLLVTCDRFVEGAGTLARFTLQLTQRGARHVRVERSGSCSASGPFSLAIEEACDASATAAALRIAALEDLTVTEVAARRAWVRASRAVAGAAGPLGELARAGNADGRRAQPAARARGRDRHRRLSSRRLARPGPVGRQGARPAGWHLARERKLAGTPALEAALKSLTKGTRMLVRCR